jgi:hypothetical protein
MGTLAKLEKYLPPRRLRAHNPQLRNFSESPPASLVFKKRSMERKQSGSISEAFRKHFGSISEALRKREIEYSSRETHNSASASKKNLPTDYRRSSRQAGEIAPTPAPAKAASIFLLKSAKAVLGAFPASVEENAA